MEHDDKEKRTLAAQKFVRPGKLGRSMLRPYKGWSALEGPALKISY
jgi:hypothetical protein